MSAASETTQTNPGPLAQSKYQVRFDWGLAGAARTAADADVLVWVDVLGPERARLREAAAAQGAPDAAAQPAHAHVLAALATVGAPAAILSAGLTDAAAAARWIVQLQHTLGRRTMIAVVAAAAEQPAQPDGAGIRFAVENQLAAGALIDALAVLGIDYSSPEAAVACGSFTALRSAVGHLLTASASAQELLALGAEPARIRAAGALNSVDVATVLRKSHTG